MEDEIEDNYPKRKKKRLGIAIIVVFLLTIGIGCFAFCLFGISENYSRMYHYPENVHSVMDFTGYDSQKEGQLINLNGDATFYYDKWAVSEDCMDEPTTVVDYGSGFSQAGYPKKSFGTYRWTLKGLDNSKPLKFRMGGDIYTSCRVFVDDGSSANPTLISSSGRMSKTEVRSSPGSVKWSRDFFQVASDTFDLYLEFSLVNRGYLAGGDIYLKAPDNPAKDSLLFIFGAAGGAAALILCAFSLTAFLATSEKKRGLPFFFLSISMLLGYLVTDFMYIFASELHFFMPWDITVVLNFLTVLLILLSFLYFLLSQGNKPTKVDVIVISSCLGLSILLFLVFFYSRLFHIAMVPILFCILYTVFDVIKDPDKQDISTIIPMTVAFIFFMMYVVFDFMDIADLIVYSLAGFPSIALFLMGLSSSFYFFAVTRELSRKAAQADKNALLYEKAETRTLINTINLHLLFNSLTMIESTYHSSLEQGDKAVSLLSTNLRASIDASSKNLIPLGEEMDHIGSFAEFCSMRTDKRYEVLFDIGYEDFEVPPQSLQVFVENSILHAKLSERKDPYIIVKTYQDQEQRIHIDISDNGRGFDPSSVDITKHSGIHNATTRLKIALGATTEIVSSPGQGTTVKISFFKKSEDGKDMKKLY
ncbi:MAG: histidine kinase [Bacilli bacterium]